MSRLRASALEEGDQIHAILRPLLTEVGAAGRRAALLAGRPDPRTVPFSELDQAIDALLSRMRIDPRPVKARDTQRVQVTVPPGAEAARAAEPSKPEVRELAPSAEARQQEPPAIPSPRAGDTRVPRPETVQMGAAPPQVPPPVPTDVLPRPTPAREADQMRGEGRTVEQRPTQVGRAVPPPVPTEVPTAELRRTPAGATAMPAPPLPKRASLPVIGVDEVKGPLVLARPGNAPETFQLYDDIVMLSAMNDRDGLLISTERLLVLAKLEDHVRVFIDANEAKLVGLYESQLKSFTRVPKRRPAAIDNSMPRAFVRGEKVAAVLQLIDGALTINDIMQRAPFQRLETLSVLAQLQRAGIIDI